MRELPKGLEDDDNIVPFMCSVESTNFNSMIRSLQMKPYSKSRLCVPKCHLLLLSLVRPIWR